MRRDTHGPARAADGTRTAGGGERFARQRTRLEEAEESDVGREIRAREEDTELEDAGDPPPVLSPEA